ncbi:MAG: DUF4254 domain-containing protein [Elusimicrobiota bacterium]
MENNKGLGELVASLCQANSVLWKEEDKARVGSDLEIAQAKKNIDKLNQQRNDFIEKIDEYVIQLVQKVK